MFPRPLIQAIATGVGYLSYLLCAARREALRGNLALATGASGRDLDRLCARNFAHFVRSLADYARCANDNAHCVDWLVDFEKGREHLEAGLTAGKGVILVTAHLGAWELGAIHLARKGLPVTVVTQNEPTSELHAWREEYRHRTGVRTIAIGADKFAFLEMVNTLRRNEIVALLVDRPQETSSVAVDFFGRPTLFSPGPAMLWQCTGATVLPAFVLEKPDGHYVAFATEPIAMEEAADSKSALRANSQRIASLCERIIREHPEQWFNYVPLSAVHQCHENP